MSSTNKTANYELSQFVGTDIPSILNDYNGDMRKIDTAIKAVANAEGSSASDIAGLQATVGQHTTEISGLSSTVNNVSGRVIGIESKIPANASESNKLITAQDIPEIPDITQLEQDVATLQSTVGTIGGEVDNLEAIVPATASTSNKLATMADIGGAKEVNYVQVEEVSASGYNTLADMLSYIADKYGTLDNYAFALSGITGLYLWDGTVHSRTIISGYPSSGTSSTTGNGAFKSDSLDFYNSSSPRTIQGISFNNSTITYESEVINTPIDIRVFKLMTV